MAEGVGVQGTVGDGGHVGEVGRAVFAAEEQGVCIVIPFAGTIDDDGLVEDDLNGGSGGVFSRHRDVAEAGSKRVASVALEEHFQRTGFPHEFDGFGDTLIRRWGYVDQSQADGMRKRLDRYRLDRSSLISTEPQNYAVPVHLVQMIILPAMVMCILVLSIFFVVFSRGKRIPTD